MQRSYLLFENAIDSKATLKLYKGYFEKYMEFVKYLNRFDNYLELDHETIHKHLEDYVIALRHTGLRGTTIRGRLKPVYLFLDVNRKQYFPKSINRLIPKDKNKKGNDKPFTDEDIQKMLESTTSKRNKALILFFSSIGGRPSVLVDPILCFKHLHAMPFGCKAVLMYSGSDEEFWGFLTPEASKALDEYRDERIRKGEKINQDSPIFVIGRKPRFKQETYLSLPDLNSIFDIILKKAQIERIKTDKRYDKATLYGFRKRFNTILKLDSNVNSNIAEKLLAHKNGLDGVYLKPTREECFAEFVKAIPKLTVNKAEKMRIKLEELKSEKDEKIIRLENEIKAIHKLLERINTFSPSMS